MTGLRYLLIAAVAALCADVISSCMCMPSHPQTHFCNSDFVFRGKVLSKTMEYRDRDPTRATRIVYRIQPRNIFLNNGTSIKLTVGQAVEVSTSGYESTCRSVNMERGMPYLVTAKEIGGRVITSLCAWNVQWNALTMPQRRMLETGQYNATCNQATRCEVRKHCGAPLPATCGEFDGCTFHEDDDCSVTTSYCNWKNGACSWSWTWTQEHQSVSYRSKYNNCRRLQAAL